MFITKKHIARRTFLRGAGVTLALPFLESMVHPFGANGGKTKASRRLPIHDAWSNHAQLDA
jgi:hypothetical protein